MKALLVFLLIFVVACTAPTALDNSTLDAQEEVATPSNPKLTDLSPGVYADSLYLSPGEEIELWLVVKNSGFTEVKQDSSYQLILLKGETEIESSSGTFSTNLLASNEEKAVAFTHTFNEVGEYELKGRVDTQNVVEEKNEENNEASLTIYVRVESDDEDESSDSDDSSDSSDDSSENENNSTSSFEGGCEDSDDGKKYNEVGTCTDVSFPGGRTDFCRSDSDLAELFCQADRCNFDIHECDGVCRDGKCI